MATVSEPPTTARSIRHVDDWIWLTGMIAASIVLRLVVNGRFQAPTILTDELTYAQLARSIADGGLSLTGGYGVVYPLLISPAWLVTDSGTEAFTYMKAINAVLVSLTAIPVYLWSRRLMRHGYALLAAGLTLLLPMMAFSGHVMTENAYLPVVILALWVIALAVERPTIARQVLVVGVLVLAFLTKAQAIALVAALPAIVIIAAVAEERASPAFHWSGLLRRLARWWPLAALGVLAILGLAMRSAVSGSSWSSILQAYSATASGQYTASEVVRYFVWHVGEATFALGVIPISALLLLLGYGILNRTRSPAERAFLVVALLGGAITILQVAVFTSYWSERVSERNMACVFPLAMIGLALWLDRGLPRPTRTTALAAAVAGSAVLCVPFAYLYLRSPSTETWAIVLPELLTRRVSGGVEGVQILIVVGTATALLVFGLLRRNVAVIAIPLLLVGYFAISSAASVHQVGKVARDYRNAPGIGMDADWVDRSVPDGAGVALLTGTTLGPDTDRIIGWQTSFFNRTPFEWRNWGADVIFDPLTGVVSSPNEPLELPEYVITPSSQRFVGEVIADRGAFLLQRPSRPYQLVYATSGLFADGWTGATASIDVFRGGNESMDVAVGRSGSPPALPTASVTVTSGRLIKAEDDSVTIGEPLASAAGTVTPTAPFAAAIATPAAPYRVAFTVDPTFSPSEFGSPDTRPLGAKLQVSFGDIRVGVTP